MPRVARGVPGRSQDLPKVEAVQVGEVRDPLYIPDEVVDYFDGQGRRLCLASGQTASIDQRALIDSYPLHESDFSDDAEAEKIKNLLKRNNFRLTPDGNYKRSDCLLFVQTNAAYEAFVEAGYREYLRQTDPEAVHGKMQELTDEIHSAGLTRSGVRAELSEFQI